MTSTLDKAILDFIESDCPTDAAFNDLALRLFEYQFTNNAVYQRFCTNRNQTPDNTNDWRNIPAVPTDAFKSLDFCCFPPENAVRTFRSSGTTQEDRSRHHLDTLALYNASLLPNFRKHMLPDGASLPFICLTPSETAQNESSLIYMIDFLMKEVGANGSGYFVDTDGTLQFEELARQFDESTSGHQPVMFLGAAFSFVHLLDHCKQSGKSFDLPAGTRVMETGGYKGKSREIPREELHRTLSESFGIPRSHIVNEYGMSELCVQFYDVNLNDAINGRSSRAFKSIPHWSRVRVLNPETMEETYDEGLIQICDLSNRGSAIQLLTADWGVRRDEGFEVLGRAPGAASKGCSLTLDELLSSS